MKTLPNKPKARLSQEIERAYSRLIGLLAPLSPESRTLKEIEGTGGLVSAADLIAYQIGWGKRVIEWYETGIQGKMPEMPGDGFKKWDYTAIARHFYQKYPYDHSKEQERVFHDVVLQILSIVEKEEQTGNIHRLGIWPWCTLPSKKQWTLSKWIQVNTASPYKRASLLIKKWPGYFSKAGKDADAIFKK